MKTASKKIISGRGNFVTLNSAGMSRRHKLRLCHRYVGQFAARWDSFVGTFGEKFREERERRGFTLDDVSNVTKINSRMLQAIEQEHFDILPGGVFNKGFVRAYAKVLGFNTEESITGYLAALRQAQLDAQNLAWDQAPQRTTTSHVAQGRTKAPVTESFKLPEQSSPPPNLKWTNIKPVVGGTTGGQPLIPKPSLQEPPPAQSASQESQPLNSKVPPALVEPPTVQPPTVQPPSVQPSTVQPPPLWISPPSASPSLPKPLAVPPPVLQPASLPPSSVPHEVPEQPSTSQIQQAGPQVPIERQAPKPQIASSVSAALQKKYAAAAVAVPLQNTTSAPWKIPILILAIGVIFIAALLWGRHPRQAATPITEPAKTESVNTNASASSGTATASPAQSGSPSAALPSTTAAASAKTPGLDAGNSAAEPSSLASQSGSVTTHAAKAKAQPPVPFRLAIRASENCSISISADGELVARENLIAPANTSVKASHEIVVQVSNPAGISFSWNDHPVPGQAAEAGAAAKTFIFDNTGLRTTPEKPIRQ
jgi:cytoskeletal protein RodZ